MKLLLVVVLFAVLTYLAIRWMQGRDGGAPAQRWQGRPKPPTKPVAPDDDENFLRELEWKRRQAERRAQKPPPDEPAP